MKCIMCIYIDGLIFRNQLYATMPSGFSISVMVRKHLQYLLAIHNVHLCVFLWISKDFSPFNKNSGMIFFFFFFTKCPESGAYMSIAINGLNHVT